MRYLIICLSLLVTTNEATMLNKIDIKIMGDIWTVTLYSPEAYKRKHSDDSAGLTIAKLRKIELDSSELDLELVIHELVHAYKSYQYVDSAELKDDQLEEVYADLFAHHGEQIISDAKKLLKHLRKYKDD